MFAVCLPDPQLPGCVELSKNCSPFAHNNRFILFFIGGVFGTGNTQGYWWNSMKTLVVLAPQACLSRRIWKTISACTQHILCVCVRVYVPQTSVALKGEMKPGATLLLGSGHCSSCCLDGLWKHCLLLQGFKTSFHSNSLHQKWALQCLRNVMKVAYTFLIAMWEA